jgi:hypothetical protein
LEDCIALYGRAIYNASNSQGPFFNTQMWGQTLVHFGVQSSQDSAGPYPTTEEKFKPLFFSEVQNNWLQFFGSIAYQDPEAEMVPQLL